MLYDMFTPKERIFNMKEGRGNGFFSMIQSDKNKYHSVQADEKKNNSKSGFPPYIHYSVKF